MGRLTPQERREIYILGLKREMQVQEICARYDISRKLYNRIAHRGEEALAQAFATRKPGKLSREEQLGAAAPLARRLEAELEQATAPGNGACGRTSVCWRPPCSSPVR